MSGRGGVPSSGIYTGTIRHRRFTPVAHAFEYPLFMTLIDIDAIPSLMRSSWLTALNRANVASFHDADHLRDVPPDGVASLRDRLARAAADSGIVLTDGPVRLLTHLRYFGYVFNPVSFFFAYTRDGALDWIMAEVSNTFGGSHRYWLDRRRLEPRGRTVRASAGKQLYVSPFLTADLEYVFTFSAPRDRFSVHIDAVGEGARVFDATLSLKRDDWSPRSVRRALIRYPWMTARVIGAIHWQALRLWRKGVPVVPRTRPHGAAG